MMTPAARSLQVFGIYLVGAGALLMLAPQWLLAPLAVAVPPDGWHLLAGMLVAFLGYLVGARSELLTFMRATVWVRASVVLFFAAFVVFGTLPAPMLLFAAVDLAAAAWTALALRAMGAPLVLRAA